MTYAIYTGHETLTFPDYTDLGTGRTLTAEPGKSYDVSPASGRAVPDIPEGWFVPADPEEWEAARAAAEAERLVAENAAAEDGAGDGPAPDASGEDTGSGEQQPDGQEQPAE